MVVGTLLTGLFGVVLVAVGAGSLKLALAGTDEDVEGVPRAQRKKNLAGAAVAASGAEENADLMRVLWGAIGVFSLVGGVLLVLWAGVYLVYF